MVMTIAVLGFAGFVLLMIAAVVVGKKIDEKEDNS